MTIRSIKKSNNNVASSEIQSADDQTIIAQCTPQGQGALALIRISGPDAILIADRISLLNSKKKLKDLPSHTLHYGSLVNDQQQVVDQVLFLLMRAPKTFTGQNTVEISCHNNQFIIQEIIQLALMQGARIAQEGEFSRRAFLNKKIDLTQAEAINELINASTQIALKQSLSQLQGSLSAWISLLEDQLVNALALANASFEFLDDENIEFADDINNIINNILSDIIKVKKTYNQQNHIRQGVRICLIGSVNAGKSSLFNAILNKNRSIVTEIAGTTRDTIEAGLYKNGNYWTLIDTAGLRTTQDVIEKEGIERSLYESQTADVILLVVDQSRPLSNLERQWYDDFLKKHTHKIILLYNKIDIKITNQNHFEHPLIIETSNKEKNSITLLEQKIDSIIQDLFKKLDSPFLLNQRHYNLLVTFEQKLLEILNSLNTRSYELIAYHIQEALEQITQFTGKSIAEQSMDAIFRKFCIGK